MWEVLTQWNIFLGMHSHGDNVEGTKFGQTGFLSFLVWKRELGLCVMHYRMELGRVGTERDSWSFASASIPTLQEGEHRHSAVDSKGPSHHVLPAHSLPTGWGHLGSPFIRMQDLPRRWLGSRSDWQSIAGKMPSIWVNIQAQDIDLVAPVKLKTRILVAEKIKPSRDDCW